jgi:hypothetical protein
LGVTFLQQSVQKMPDRVFEIALPYTAVPRARLEFGSIGCATQVAGAGPLGMTKTLSIVFIAGRTRRRLSILQESKAPS